MRRLTVLMLLLASATHGQTKVFNLDNADSIYFKNFLADKKVFVVGEMHGTAEVPIFVLSIIRQLSEKGKTLTIGLEIPANYQNDIVDFLKKGDFDKLLKLDYFKYPDGRSSVAMGQLIKGLRKIQNINVICFDLDTGHAPGVNRDSLMGINLSKNYKGEQMVILTGNLHANLKEGYWRPNFKSAIFHFNRIMGLDDKLISLNTYYGGGTIWNCMQDGCKERDAGSNGNLNQPHEIKNFIKIYDAIHPSGYSGFVYFEKVTASKPMVN